MSTRHDEEIASRIRKLGANAVDWYAAGVAEVAANLFPLFGSVESQPSVTEAQALVWSDAAASAFTRMSKTMRGLAEADEDDSRRPEYVAGLITQALERACEVRAAKTLSKRRDAAVRVFKLTQYLFGALGWWVERPPPGVGGAAKKGSIEDREARRQLQSLDVLEKAPDAADAVRLDARDLAAEITRKVRPLLPPRRG